MEKVRVQETNENEKRRPGAPKVERMVKLAERTVVKPRERRVRVRRSDHVGRRWPGSTDTRTVLEAARPPVREVAHTQTHANTPKIIKHCNS